MAIDRAQLNWLQDARVSIGGFAGTAAASNVITSALTTALSTAGDNGVAVPLQIAGANALGVITTPPDNVAIVLDATNKRPLADVSGNEIYGKITEAAGVYTLSYFKLVAGVETIHTFASANSLDVFFAYRYDAARFPKNAGLVIGGRIINQDPSSSGGGSTVRSERLTVTATNTFSALTVAPTSATNIILIVGLNGGGESVNPFGGAAAAFSVSGTTITWSAVNAGYSVPTTYQVTAVYW